VYTNFIHEAIYSEYGSTTYGRIMDYEKVPPGLCMEVEEWCNAVWLDMKQRCVNDARQRTQKMLPKRLIRTKVYQIQAAPPQVEEVIVKENNYDHLKLENYLIKEDPEVLKAEERQKQAEAESMAKAAELEEKTLEKAKKEEEKAEKDAKKSKAEEKASEDDEYEEEYEKPKRQKKVKKDPYDDYDDE
jgi:flagellar biosynthesis GTPase FlhF